MNARINIAGRLYSIDLENPIDLSISLDFEGEQPRAFGLSRASSKSVAEKPEKQASPIRCSQLTLIPHANGTHTESAGHLSSQSITVGEAVEPGLTPAVLVTVAPNVLGDVDETYRGYSEHKDSVITAEALEQACESTDCPDAFTQSVVIRTEPNPLDKKARDYSGTNPPYLTDQAIEYLNDLGCKHLLCDLPSIDREDDGGLVPNHRTFWRIQQNDSARPGARSKKTVTELIYAPNNLTDGFYLLDLQVPNFSTDAAPSRPVFFPLLDRR